MKFKTATLAVLLYATLARAATFEAALDPSSVPGQISGTLQFSFSTTNPADYNPATGYWVSIIKETSPTTFEVEQTVQTKPGGKCSTLDTKTGHILVSAIEALPAPAAGDAATPAPTPAASPATNAPAGGQRRGGRGGGPGLLDLIVVGK